MFELLVLGVIAFLLIYRLFSVLGQRTGFEQPQAKDNIIPLDKKKEAEPTVEDAPEDMEIPKKFATDIQKIKAQDPSFTLKAFLEGATMAFEFILDAYAKGDKKALKPLLDIPVFKNFAQAIQERADAKRTLDTTIIRIASVDLQKAKVEKTMAVMTVKFVSEQTHVLRDEKGKILEGNPQQIEETKDIWTFSRDLRSSDPNWLLVSTSV